ncbi:MAG TPA: serine/threonine-protein kinase [Myxococcota bacterium]|nr:serine/threonine-protein kinase [Myxococcota bacterium]
MVFEPTTFGRYILLKRIAIGGMAEVFRAVAYGAEGFEKLVAIKRMLPHLSDDPQFVDMFVNEARLAANLNHGNIIQIFDFGTIKDLLFLSMEYVRGKNFAEIIDVLKAHDLSAPIELACHVAIQTLNGLDYAHRALDRHGNPANLIHRDVSPPNIIVSFDGEVKVGDFGIAKATETGIRTGSGVLKGKYAYMSPEQAGGFDMDPRTDIFSLGVCFYELLTLIEAFGGNSDLGVLRAIRAAEVTPPRELNPAIPEELESIMYRALEKEPADRFESAAEMRDALEQFMISKNLRFSASWLSNFMRDIFRDEIEQERAQLVRETREAEHLRDEAKAVARLGAFDAGDVDTMIYPDLLAKMARRAARRDGPAPEPLDDTLPLGAQEDREENTEEIERYQEEYSYSSSRPRPQLPSLDPETNDNVETAELSPALAQTSGLISAVDFMRTDRGAQKVRADRDNEDFVQTDDLLAQVGSRQPEYEPTSAEDLAGDEQPLADPPGGGRRLGLIGAIFLLLLAVVLVGLYLYATRRQPAASEAGADAGALEEQDAGIVAGQADGQSDAADQAIEPQPLADGGEPDADGRLQPLAADAGPSPDGGVVAADSGGDKKVKPVKKRPRRKKRYRHHRRKTRKKKHKPQRRTGKKKKKSSSRRR